MYARASLSSVTSLPNTVYRPFVREALVSYVSVSTVIYSLPPNKSGAWYDQVNVSTSLPWVSCNVTVIMFFSPGIEPTNRYSCSLVYPLDVLVFKVCVKSS